MKTNAIRINEIQANNGANSLGSVVFGTSKENLFVLLGLINNNLSRVKKMLLQVSDSNPLSVTITFIILSPEMQRTHYYYLQKWL